MHPLKGTLSREKVILNEVTTFLLPPNRERDCYLTRSEVAICTIAGFSTGLDLASDPYCTMHPSGSRCSIFIALVKRSRGSGVQRRYDLCSLLLLTSHPCPLLRTQKMTGSRPCPRERDNSHGFWVPAFQWLTAWSVKMEISDRKAGRNESPINIDGWTSKKSGSPFQPLT